MALLHYSENESLERIYKMLSAADNPDDIEGLLGQMSRDEALTRIAQLLEGSLGSATLSLPSAMAATAEQANARSADAVNTVMITPASHHWAHEFGGIYVATGTVNQAFPQTTWTKITGTFHGYMQDSGSEIDSDWNDDRIVVDEPSDYLAAYQISWWTWSGATPKLQVQVYVNGTAQPQTRAIQTMGASGTVSSISGIGMVDIVSGTYAVDLRVSASAASTVHIETAQLTVTKMVGG